MTGAAPGIGAVAARRFAEAGASLALLEVQAEALRSLAVELGCVADALDLADEAAIAGAVTRAGEALGGIDGMLNVAGISGPMTPLAEMTTAGWNRVLSINLIAPFIICRQALPFLRASTDPCIVNVASAAGLMPDGAGLLAYATSKGGLMTLTKAMAHELARHVWVNVVCPEPVDTPLLPEAVHDYVAAPALPYLLKRVATPDEIVAAYLSSAGPRAASSPGRRLRWAGENAALRRRPSRQQARGEEFCH